MKNWKITTRITAGFGAVILAALALDIFAHSRVCPHDKDFAPYQA